MRMSRMKYTLKDSVFTFIFKQPEYTRQPCLVLHPEDTAVTEADCKLLTLENVLTTGVCGEADAEPLWNRTGDDSMSGTVCGVHRRQGGCTGNLTALILHSSKAQTFDLKLWKLEKAKTGVYGVEIMPWKRNISFLYPRHMRI